MLSSSRSLKFALSEYSAKEAVESCCLGRCPLSLLLLFCSSPFICQNFRTTSTLGEERREKKERLLSNWLFRHHGYSREAFFLPDSNSMSGKSNIKKFETYFVFGSSRLSRRDKRIIHLRKKPERYLLEFLTMAAIISHQILNY